MTQRGQHKPEWVNNLKKARKALDILDKKLEMVEIADYRYKSRAEQHKATPLLEPLNSSRLPALMPKDD